MLQIGGTIFLVMRIFAGRVPRHSPGSADQNRSILGSFPDFTFLCHRFRNPFCSRWLHHLFCPCCAKCGPLHGQWYPLLFQYRLSGSTKPGIKFPPILCVCFPFQTQYFFRSTQRINKLIRLYRSTHFSQWINLVPNWN